MTENILNIKIQLNANLSIGDSFNMYVIDEIGEVSTIKQTVSERRLGPNQVTIGETVGETLSYLNQALNFDYGTNFDVELIEDALALNLISKKINLSFDRVELFPPDLPITVDPIVVPVENFKINTLEFLPTGLNPCGNILIKITASQPVARYCVNNVCFEPNSPVVEFLYNRGLNLTIELTNYLGAKISRNIQTPPPLETASERIRLYISDDVNGGSVQVIHPYTTMLNYEFSLDDNNWQGSNGFYGLPVGSYTMYIRDQYGCKKLIPFNILEKNLGEPYVLISKENSFRFIEPKKNFYNDESRNFCKSPAILNYGYIQEFLNTDVITTQFRSNYKNIEVRIHEQESKALTIIPPVKKTSNIGNKVKYNQVRKYRIDNNQFGIYFESGQILNYDNNAFIDVYELNGSLPVWAKLGNIISIDSVKYKIESIGFDETVNAEVLIFSGYANFALENVVVSSVYNINNYEVYEFTVDFSMFANKEIRIEIINSDPNYGEYVWLSESILTKEDLTNYLEIRYLNTTNTNIMYSSGIKHLLRLPYNTIKANDSDTNENYNSDTNTHLLDSKIYEVTDFEFMPFPLELYRKLKIALSMDNVFIDEVGYTKNAEFTKENLGLSNLYKLTASMIKNGFVFNSSSNIKESIVDNPNINVPGLIQLTSNGYIEL